MSFGRQYRRGLVVGKFCPLHRGHMLVIDAALAACDEVAVISYTNPEFDGCGPALREEWIRELYPQVRVLVLEGGDIALPANDAPEAVHRDFVGWLCDTVLQMQADAVFTSEDYGDGFAAALTTWFAARGRAGGDPVVHVCVDKARGIVPVSGTAIRSDPFAHRACLHPRVYASFVKRVAILGGESSGKTTLAQQLAEVIGSVWAPEYGRERWVEKAGDLTFDDLREIAAVQVAREEQLLQEARRWLVCDTTPLTTLCYSLEMFGAADPVVEQLALRKYELVLLCAPDFAFVQDGTRRDAAFREKQHQWYRAALDKSQIAYTVVAGPPHERLSLATSLLT